MKDACHELLALTTFTNTYLTKEGPGPAADHPTAHHCPRDSDPLAGASIRAQGNSEGEILTACPRRTVLIRRRSITSRTAILKKPMAPEDPRTREKDHSSPLEAISATTPVRGQRHKVKGAPDQHNRSASAPFPVPHAPRGAG